MTSTTATTLDPDGVMLFPWMFALVDGPWSIDQLSDVLDVAACMAVELSERECAQELNLTRAKVRWLKRQIANHLTDIRQRPDETGVAA